MAQAPYKVTIFNNRIISLIQTGDGDRWTHSTARRIEQVARATAPSRTGRLIASHVTLPTVGSNAYVKRYRVSAQAPYAIYPHEGTGIFGPKHKRVSIGKWMKIPGRVTRIGSKGNTVIWSHKGQPAKKWLELAAEAVVATV